MEIPLVDAVAAVRDQLLEAAARGVGQDVVFAVGDVQLEFAVELRADASVKGGIKAYLFSAEAGVSGGRASTNRVSITLRPRSREGGELLISGDRARAEGPGKVDSHMGR